MAEEEEGEGTQVENGLGMGLVMVLGKAGDEGMEDGDVDGPHPGGGGCSSAQALKRVLRQKV